MTEFNKKKELQQSKPELFFRRRIRVFGGVFILFVDLFFVVSTILDTIGPGNFAEGESVRVRRAARIRDR